MPIGSSRAATSMDAHGLARTMTQLCFGGSPGSELSRVRARSRLALNDLEAFWQHDQGLLNLPIWTSARLWSTIVHLSCTARSELGTFA